MTSNPLLPLAAAFSLGIFVSAGTEKSPVAWCLAALVMAVAALAAGGLFGRRGVAGALLLVAVAAAGGFAMAAVTAAGQALAPFRGSQVEIEGVVVMPPRKTGSSVSSVLAVEGLNVCGGWQSAEGKVLIIHSLRDRSLWVYGDRVRVRGRLQAPRGPRNPGDRDNGKVLRLKGIGHVLVAQDWRVVRAGEGDALHRLAYRLRDRLGSVIDRTLSPRRAVLLRGLLLGDRQGLAAGETESYRRAGLAHVLSVSGLHVGFVAGGLMAVTRMLRLGVTASLAVILPCLVVYAVMTGAAPPVLRAAAMFVGSYLGRCLGRPASGVNMLAAALIVVLIPSPGALFDVGLQLSFAAMAGIILLYQPLWGWFRRLFPSWVAAPLAITIAAQIATLPLVLRYFGSVSTVGVLANLVAVPLAGVAVVLGFAGSVAGLFLPVAATVINGVTAIPLAGLTTVAEAFGALPGAALAMRPPTAAGVMVYYGVLLAVLGLGRLPRAGATGWRLFRAVFLPVVAIVALVCHPPSFVSWPVRLVFLDVGQGDAAVAFLPGGRVLVVDGGASAEPDGPLPRYLRYAGVRRVDYLVLSHADRDHIAGLIPVVEGFEVGEVWENGYPAAGETYARLGRAINAKGAPVRRVGRGDVFRPAPGVVLEVVNPPVSYLSGTRADENNNSLVLRLIYGEVSYLLAGDLEREGEERLLASGLDLRGTVLKLGHHGGTTAGGDEFIRAVRPRAVVISVGGNAFGMPAPATLSRVGGAGATVWRTDRQGAVSAATDGRRLLLRATRQGNPASGNRQIPCPSPIPAG